MRSAGIATIALSVAFVVGPIHAAEHATVGRDGVVATDHPLASRAGIEVLQRGGNAVDAACAAAFALGVVNPAGSGLGGGGFALIRTSNGSPPVALDFRETAPAAATRDMFVSAGTKQASHIGGLAVGVPGEVRGCADAVARYGKLSLRRILQPAIRLARKGFAVGPHLARSLKGKAAALAADPRLAGLFRIRSGGRGPKRIVGQGERLRRPRLARALAAIAKGGPQVFYRGWIAKDIAQTVQRAGGLLTRKDLLDYRAKWRQPLHVRFSGHDLYFMPPPSSGGVALVQVLNVLRRHDLGGLGHNSTRYVHLLAEALKHAFADRARYGGDADFIAWPVQRLTSQRYADALDKLVGEHVIAPGRYGSAKGLIATPSDSGTSHISVIDRHGMAISLTTSINRAFGARFATQRSAILLNDTMDDFAARPGRPNSFGLVQSEANAVAPGKRPLSSMTPVIALRDGRPTLVAGGSGGPTIITATLQVLLNTLVFNMPLGKAISSPRIHHQWLPNVLWLEEDLAPALSGNLAGRGHRIESPPPLRAAVQAASDGYALHAASDPRKDGVPASY